MSWSDMKFIYISMTQRAVGLMAGLSLIIVGIVADAKTTPYMGFFVQWNPTLLNPISISLNTIGVLIFIVGFFGCCSVSRSGFYVVLFIVVFMCSLLVAEIVSVVAAVILQYQMMHHLKNAWLSTLREYNHSTHLSQAWDYVQQQFSCCGVTNYTNWAEVDLPEITMQLINSTRPKQPVPESCCHGAAESHPGCGGLDLLDEVTTSSTESESILHTQGCATSVLAWLEDNTSGIVAFMAYLTVAQLIGIVLTSTLARNVRIECNQSLYSNRLKQLKQTQSSSI